MLTPVMKPAVSLATIALTKIVAVVFPGNATEYSYYSDIEGLEVGDFAIVASPHGNMSSMHKFFSQDLDGYPTVVRVVRTEETVKDVSKAAKWIIQKVDIDRYVERLAIERKVEVLKAKIKKAKNEAIERAQLATLCEINPELATLVTELATLTGQTIEAKPIPVRAHKRKVAKPKAVSKGTAKPRSRAKK